MSEFTPAPLTPEQAERLEWLAAQRVTEGLSPDERRELDGLLASSGASDDNALAYAAAVLQRNETEMIALPASLRQRLEADSQRYTSEMGDRNDRAAARTGPARWRIGGAFALGALSAAALIALAFTVFQFDEPAAPEPGDWLSRDWAGVVEGYEQVTGQVRWSKQRQGGEMRFTGLPANDPEQGQYQLWIVDPSRDAEPVDGGVFDVTPDANGEAVVAFTAKLPVDQPTVFAVTYEQPGGVVVSEGPLLVVAEVGAS